MPRRGAAHLRCVVGDDDAGEIVFLQNVQHAQHVHFAVINERLFVVWHLVADVAEVDVAEFVLAAAALPEAD